MHHLSTELMLSLTGTRMQHVPYKATPPALTDLLAGRLQVLFGDGPSVLPQIREGKLRALAVSTAKRSPATPDVPTMQEAGIAGFESAAWQMIIAPAGTPPEIVALLNKEVRAIFSEPEVMQELTQSRHGPAGDRHRPSNCRLSSRPRSRAGRRSFGAPEWPGTQ